MKIGAQKYLQIMSLGQKSIFLSSRIECTKPENISPKPVDWLSTNRSPKITLKPEAQLLSACSNLPTEHSICKYTNCCSHTSTINPLSTLHIGYSHNIPSSPSHHPNIPNSKSKSFSIISKLQYNNNNPSHNSTLN